jgi:two-component system, OmpR family, sensor histidine kinase ChvG
MDLQDRHEAEEFNDVDEAHQQPLKPRGFFNRIAPGSLTSRIALINILGLVILTLGILYFNQFRQSLINARVQSLMVQGQIIAAAIAGSASADTSSIVIDPQQLNDQTAQDSGNVDQGALDFPISPETAGPVLRRLLANTTIRAQIIDPGGNLLVDSLSLYGGPDIVENRFAPPDSKLLSYWKYMTKPFDRLFSYDYPVHGEYGMDGNNSFPEVAAALNGASVSVVRLNPSHEIIVLVSVPVQRFRAVLGTLVLSTKGGEIDAVLNAERHIVIFTFGFAAFVALLLSALLAGTIAQPIRRLSAAAERVRRGVNNKRVEIPDFTSRKDEIGQLSGSLRDMTNALYQRIEAIEAFAADVSHELKNPLTSLRSAVETLSFVKTDEQRNRLIEIVVDDVKRMDRLITDISDASRLDAELARAEIHPVDISKLLGSIIGLANETGKAGAAEILLIVQPITEKYSADTKYQVLGNDSRLGQVFRNLIDNARSFTADGTKIIVRLRRIGETVEVRIEDSGPGIRPENLERVFERFYTDRPVQSFGKNSGLGLAISRQVVEAHKGRIYAENRLGKADEGGDKPILGARFVVRIPILTEEWKPADQQ